MAQKRNNVLVIKQVVDAMFSSLPTEKHFTILREMFDFSTVINFKKTIEELIEIEQMHVFGISLEMQSILKHFHKINMLGKMSFIRNALHARYEEMHNRTIVLIKISESNMSSLNDITVAIRNKINTPCDFIYIPSNVAGVTVQFKDQILQYTPSQIAKQMKAV